MCKGIAIGINDKNIVMNYENSSHTNIKNFKEDEYLKINLIYDITAEHKYRIEVDNHDETQIEEYKKKCFINPDGTIINSYLERLNKFIKENEVDIFKLFCSGLMQNSTLKSQDNTSATIGESQDNGSATIGESQDNGSATIGKYQYNNSAKIGKYQNNGYATIGKSQGNNFAKIGEYQYNNFAKIGESQYNTSATMKQMYIKNLTLKSSKKYTDLIKKWSETQQKEYDFVSFCNWLLKNKRK
jgi:hypothetical protein